MMAKHEESRAPLLLNPRHIGPLGFRVPSRTQTRGSCRSVGHTDGRGDLGLVLSGCCAPVTWCF